MSQSEEDHGKRPPELQQRVHLEVELTKRRSGSPAGRALSALGVSRTTYYRWLLEEAWSKTLPSSSFRPVQVYEALPEEKATVTWYALEHPELRHRELAWRMVDEYSRYIVHHELLWGMNGISVSIVAQSALETLPRDAEGKLLEPPVIRSDNGSCYIFREFSEVLKAHELKHHRIKPHCPEENGTMERANRTIDEALEGEELTDYLEGVKVMEKMIRWYNNERLHSAIGFLRPVDFYRGNPEELFAVRRRKLAEARHRRRERNLELRRPTLLFPSGETVA